MKRRAAAVFLAACTAAAAVVTTPSPAAAVAVCTGQGVLMTGTPIYHHVIVTGGVVVTAPVTTYFAASITIGACAGVTTSPTLGITVGDPFTLTGTKSGWCGQSTGTGVTNRGSRFAWVEVGSKMIFTGELVGIVSGYVPDVLAGQSCVTGATRFLMGWSVFAETHCLSKSKTSGTLPLPSTSTTPVSGVDVHTAPVNYWGSLCVPTPSL